MEAVSGSFPRTQLRDTASGTISGVPAAIQNIHLGVLITASQHEQGDY
jgi:hypothetical protein